MTEIEETPKSELPTHSLAELIRVAVRDARQLDKAMYYPTASVWHDPDAPTEEHQPAPRCRVCDAGAVMAGTLGGKPNDERAPSDYNNRTGRALLALNHAREGDWEGAYLQLRQYERAHGVKHQLQPRPVDTSYQGWSQFESHLDSMEPCADALERFEINNPLPVYDHDGA